MYTTLKTIHALTAILSISGFLLRGVWMWTDSSYLKKKWVKIAPHINDTVLLLSAIYLVVSTQQYPFVETWVTAKVGALLAYIVLGTIALKRGKTRQQRRLAYVGAIVVFAYMLNVAVTKQAMPWF